MCAHQITLAPSGSTRGRCGAALLLRLKPRTLAPRPQTMTTAGYGDLAPVTNIGRLMACGWLVRPSRRPQARRSAPGTGSEAPMLPRAVQAAAFPRSPHLRRVAAPPPCPPQIVSIIYASVLTSIVCSKLTVDTINGEEITDLSQAGSRRRPARDARLGSSCDPAGPPPPSPAGDGHAVRRVVVPAHPGLCRGAQWGQATTQLWRPHHS